MPENTSTKVWIINMFAGHLETGWGERHFLISHHLQKLGYDVTIISGTYNHLFTHFPPSDENYNFEEVDGVKFCWVKTPKYKTNVIGRLWSWTVFSWRIRQIPVNKLGVPSAVVVSSLPLTPVFNGHRLKRLFKATFLFEVRDLWPETLKEIRGLSDGNVYVKVLGWIANFGYRKADAVISLLSHSHEYLETLARKKLKWYYVPNGYNSFDEPVIDVHNLPKHGYEDAEMVIGYAGTLREANAMEFFVEAARNIEKINSKIHFVIVGDGDVKNDLIQQANNASNIHFLPRVKKQEVRKIVQTFDVGFASGRTMESYKYGVSPNKVFDYMSNRKPYILGSVSNHCPGFEQGVVKVVTPENVQEIVDAVMSYYEMGKEKRKEIGERARQYALENHHFKVLAEKYDQAIRLV